MKVKKRRLKGKTDYRGRIAMLKSGRGRIVFRKTNRYIIGQYVKSREAKDKVIVGVNSKKLLEYGWPSSASGSLKSLPASYLSGFLLGKQMLERGEKEGVFDLGLIRNIRKSRAYAFLKGVTDVGVKVNAKENIFPEDKRIKGGHLKIDIDVNKIKQTIENKPLEKVSKHGIKPYKPLEKVSKREK